jgi:hypothetical protein
VSSVEGIPVGVGMGVPVGAGVGVFVGVGVFEGPGGGVGVGFFFSGTRFSHSGSEYEDPHTLS